MIIIVEGLDSSGKSTLCKAFSKKYNYEYIKESYIDDNIEKEMRVAKLLERLISRKNYIYDRTTLIDDFVYSFLNKQQSTLINYKVPILNLLSKCKIIHIEIDEKIRKKRMQERGDEYIAEKDIKKIIKNYNEFYKQLNNVEYLIITEDTDKNVELLMEVAND